MLETTLRRRRFIDHCWKSREETSATQYETLSNEYGLKNTKHRIQSMEYEIRNLEKGVDDRKICLNKLKTVQK